MIGAQENPQMPPKKIALIIDGVVQEVLHTDERLAAIFLSEPIIVDATDMYSEESLIGKSYDSATGAFATVDVVLEEQPVELAAVEPTE